MEKLKQLVVAVQILSGAAGMFRVVYLIMQHLHDEDYTQLKQKVKNVIIMVILIEGIIVIADIIQKYYI